MGIQQTLLVAPWPAPLSLSAILGLLPGLLPQFSPSYCEHLTHFPPFRGCTDHWFECLPALDVLKHQAASIWESSE